MTDHVKLKEEIIELKKVIEVHAEREIDHVRTIDSLNVRMNELRRENTNLDSLVTATNEAPF